MDDDPWPSTHMSLLLRVSDPRSEVAWSDFVTRYRPPIVRLARGVFRVQEATADDLANDILVKLLCEMQRFEYKPEESFRRWLRTVTKNTIRDFFRKENRRLDIATGDSNEQQLVENFADSPGADQLADSLCEELQRDLLQEAERLVRQRVSDQTWTAYKDRSDGKPAKEIAADLNMKVAAVHKANSRVPQLIREEIKMLLNQKSL